MKKFRHMLNLFIVFIVVFVLVKLTTFGFRPSFKYSTKLNASEEQTAQNLEEHVRHLAIDIGNRNYASYQNLRKTALFIQARFKSLGYEIELQSYETRGQTFNNIIAYRTKLSEDVPTFIVGAHYDSCFNPGADDNASGVAGLLELARLLKDEPSNVNLKFVAFVNEEPPFFLTESMGSRVYAKRARAREENIKGVMILEMIGYFNDARFSQRYLPLIGLFYPNRANFIATVGNFKSSTLVKDIKSVFKNNSVVPMETLLAPEFVPGVNYSDHWSFWKENYTAVMVTDTAFLRYSHYHQSGDMPEQLDFKRMSIVVHGLNEALKELISRH